MTHAGTVFLTRDLDLWPIKYKVEQRRVYLQLLISLVRSTPPSRPNKVGPSVRPSVRPSTKTFFDFNEIRYVRRGR